MITARRFAYVLVHCELAQQKTPVFFGLGNGKNKFFRSYRASLKKVLDNKKIFK